jgi:hypothetical protein
MLKKMSSTYLICFSLENSMITDWANSMTVATWHLIVVDPSQSLARNLPMVMYCRGTNWNLILITYLLFHYQKFLTSFYCSFSPFLLEPLPNQSLLAISRKSKLSWCTNWHVNALLYASWSPPLHPWPPQPAAAFPPSTSLPPITISW